MSELAGSRTVSRSALLELKAELRLVRDGYEFLDEKRILLAAEMLEQRDAYRALREQFKRLGQAAAAALLEAAANVGLDGLQVYPAVELTDARVIAERRPCVGQIMLEARLDARDGSPRHPIRPTLEANTCKSAFRKLLASGTALAAASSNLKRLTHEYRRTERRVRALENVVLPEIRDNQARMEEQLDLIEQEEVIRVRTLRSGRA